MNMNMYYVTKNYTFHLKYSFPYKLVAKVSGVPKAPLEFKFCASSVLLDKFCACCVEDKFIALLLLAAESFLRLLFPVNIKATGGI